MSRVRRTLPRPVSAAIPGAAALLALAVGPVLAHGDGLPPEPTVGALVLGWSFDPLLQLGLLGSTALYLLAVRRVDRAHPTNRVPVSRVVAFLAGIAALEMALQSGIERYDTSLFSDHMVQHMLLMFVGAPLIALGAPITLLLRAATPASRRRVALPILHSRVVRVIGHPIVAWLVFTAVMWGSHVSPLFDATLENDTLHDVEHLMFIGSALLFWWPVVGLDPTPWRLAFPLRILYLFLQMPMMSFLSLAVYAAPVPLYPHYATLDRPWGPSPLADQQAAGGIMWIWGDLTFLLSIVLVVAAWLRDEEARAARQESRIDAQRAVIRERELQLADRLAAERAGTATDPR